MKQGTFALQTADRLTLFGRVWEPENAVKGVLCLVHGLGEHSGRYAPAADFLTQAGYVLLAVDLRGHGKSPGKRGHASSYRLLLDDVRRLLAAAEERYPALPLFLYGYSMGGNLVLNFALRFRPAVRGLVVTSPWLELVFQPSRWKVRFARAVRPFWGSFSQKTGLHSGALTIGREDEPDPLAHDRISANLFLSMAEAGKWALEHAGSLSVPMLLMHGSGDQVTSLQASERLAARCPGGLCTFQRWEGYTHEMHHDAAGGPILRCMTDWLDRHAAVFVTAPAGKPSQQNGSFS
jgi:alpha-beta hydrolase superfamily lysophospholipase